MGEDPPVGVVSFRWGRRKPRENPGEKATDRAGSRQGRAVAPVHEFRSGRIHHPDQLTLFHPHQREVTGAEHLPATLPHGLFTGFQRFPTILQRCDVPTSAGWANGPEPAPGRIVGEAVPRPRGPGRAGSEAAVAECAVVHVREGCSRAFSGGSRPVCSRASGGRR